MATIKLTQKEQHILNIIATKPSKSGWVRYFDLQNQNNGYKHLERLQVMGLIEWQSGKGQRLTVAGLAYLYQDAPMVDQPQPIDEATIEGEVSFYADGKAQDGTIVAGTDRYGYTVRSVNGKVYDEVQRGDIEPRLGDEIDNLPFSEKPQAEAETPFKVGDLVYYVNVWNQIHTATVMEVEADTITILTGALSLLERKSSDLRLVTGSYNDDLPFSDVGVDEEDTKPISTITVDAPTPTLSNLIDAALDPDDTEAYAALKSYDWASVPLWIIEIERDDVNAYKWEIWHELRKMNGGILLSNPDAVYKGREVDRAFNVMTILNNAIYNFHKWVGFNVEN